MTDTARGKSGSGRREGGDLLVHALSARGVRLAYTVSGGPINSVYHASLGSTLALRHVRHEAAAGFMADATYRMTGVPGVAVVTLGPGVTNMATPLGTALRAGVPLLVVGARAPTSQVDKGAGMELPTLAAMRPLTKWAAVIPSVDRIPEYVERAWRVMLAPTPGPVYLEISSDVLSSATDLPVDDLLVPERPLPAAPHPAAVQQAVDTLRRAARPLVLLGDGVYHGGASAQARRFLEDEHLPFATLRLARGAVDEGHELCIGPGYVPANAVFRQALRSADTILVLGHDWEFDLSFGEVDGVTARVIQVHEDAGRLGRVGVSDQLIVSGVAPFLDALPALGRSHRDDAWIADVTESWRRHRQETSREADGATPMHPVALVDEVRRVAPPETVFITSHGNIDFWADAHLQIPEAGRYLRAGQSGSLGAEVPFAVGAKLADPDRPVIVLLGDGAIGYHGTELDTAVRYGANVIIIVADDQKWGAIAIPQKAAYGVEVEMDLEQRDWAGFARALGGQGEQVQELAEVGAAVERALKADRPSVIHVPIQSVLSPYMEFTTK